MYCHSWFVLQGIENYDFRFESRFRHPDLVRTSHAEPNLPDPNIELVLLMDNFDFGFDS